MTLSPTHVLAIDQGTTGTRVLISNKKGFIKGKGYLEFTQHFPRPGWVEHDAHEIWRSTLRAAEIAFRSAKVTPRQIAAIGITNQRETIVAWDRSTGRALSRAIVWQDRRTSDLCEKLKKQGLEASVKKKTGLVLDPYFSGTKIRWMLEHNPSIRAKARQGKVCFGTIESWILWNLTRGRSFATDYSNASRTLLFDIQTKKWDRSLLKIFGVQESALPAAKPCGAYFGKTSNAGPFGDGVPIHAMIGDQQAALYGQGCYAPGTVKNTYGTGCFVVLNTGRNKITSQKGLLTTLACAKDGSPVYALEGSVFIAGAVVQWVRDGLRWVKKAAETEKICRSLKDTGGVYVIPAFVGLGAPYWDSRARGAILGITRGTGRAEIIKAAVDSIAYQNADVIEAMQSESRLAIRELKVDGGATQNDYLMQFQADLLGVTIRRSSVVESTAWGAAKLAGVSSKFWSDPSEPDRHVRYQKFIPRLKSAARRSRLAEWRSNVERVLTR